MNKSETVLKLLLAEAWTPTSNSLMRMLKLIDEHHFNGFFFGAEGRFSGACAVNFSTGWRGRMTSSAACMESRAPKYFIVFSSIIFGNLARMFRDDRSATTKACGRVVTSLAGAYHVIAEHEMAHLYLCLKNSSDGHGPAFRKLVAEKFGHTEYSHCFSTARSQLAAKAVRINSVVKFDFKGQRIVGRIANIRKTATVVRGTQRWSVPAEALTPLTREERKAHGPLPAGPSAETTVIKIDPAMTKFLH